MSDTVLKIARQSPALQSRHSFLTWLLNVTSLHRQRRSLAQLDARLLDDIGLTRAEAIKESQKPVWDAPQRWRQ